LGGGVSKPFNLSHAPLIGGTVFWIRGTSLFESLLLNAPPDHDALLRRGERAERPPAWSQALPDVHERRLHEGILDYLTWQSRRITLVVGENTETPVATGLYLSQGDKEETESPFDPMMARVIPDNTRKPPFPFNFRSDKALWRDADLLYLLNHDQKGTSPLTFLWMDEWAHELERSEPFIVDAFGLVNDKAKIELWRHEQLPVLPALLASPDDDDTALPHLKRALRYADDQARILTGATRTTAEYLLRTPAPGSDEKPQADATDVRKLSDSLGATPRYWAALTPTFHTFLFNLAAAHQHEARETAVWTWAKEIFSTARTAFENATDHLNQSASQLRAVAQGQRQLRHVKPYREYRKLQPKPTQQ